jgi:hypothetical protein
MAKIDELKKKYPKVIKSVADRFFEGDKTPTKKYLEFMFKMWATRTNRPTEAFSSAQYVKVINQFDQLLPYIENKDIYSGQYKSIVQLFRVVDNAKVLKEENEFIREDHVDVLIDNEDYLLISPLTLKGSIKYGANTKWCTASKSSSYHFTSYTRDGYLFYLISKKERGKNHDKVAFYSRGGKNEHLTTSYAIYNQIDTEINEQKFILNGWTMFDLFEIMTKIRVYAYEKYVIEKAKTDVEKTVNILKSVNLDEFLQQVNLLEKYGESGEIEGRDELEKVIQTLSKKTEDLFGKSKINV